MRRVAIAALAGVAQVVAACRVPPPPVPVERRVLLVGLDAATLTVIDPMVRRGELPTFARFFEQGAAGPLATLKPTLSVVVWTSILTGESPGAHGIHGWLSESGQQLAFSSDLILKPPLWRILTARGMPSLFVNFWASWPAEDVVGGLVSNRMKYGRLASRAQPPSLERALDAVPLPPTRPAPGRDPADPLAGHLFYEDDRYVLALSDVAIRQVEKPRVVAIFLRGLDLVQHGYWHTVDETALEMLPGRDEGPLVELYYRFLDRQLARLMDEVQPTTVVVVSDHGMEALRESPPQIGGLNLNRLLERLGLLTFEPKVPRKPGEGVRRRSIDWSTTRAYTFGDSQPDLDRGVRVNVRGRDPHGVVTPAERGTVVAAIEDALRPLTTKDGRPLFTSLRVLASPAGDRPDVELDLEPAVTWQDVLVLGDGREVPMSELGQPAIAHNSGQHENAPPGVILMLGDGVKAGVRLRDAGVCDVAPTVLALLGLPAARTMAGAPLADALTFAPIAAIEGYDAPYRGSPVASDDDVDHATVQELRGLGYVQ